MANETTSLQAPDLDDDQSRFEARDTAHTLPAGWLLLAGGLVAWGVYYLWAYLPAISGWSAAGELDAPATSAGTSIFATIFFTAVATVAAVSILVAVARRRKT